MTSNFELLDIAESYGIHNLNVIMNDQLQNYKFKTGYYVVNLEDSDHGGTHWVSVIVENGRALYFDSFGVVPSLEVEEWLHNSKYKYVFNNRIIQHIDSIACGYFALGLIIYVILEKTKPLYEVVNDYLNLFDLNDYKKNDKIIMNLFETRFKILKQ